MKKVTSLELHQFVSRESYKLYQVGFGMIWVSQTGDMLAKAEPSAEPFEFQYFINA